MATTPPTPIAFPEFQKADEKQLTLWTMDRFERAQWAGPSWGGSAALLVESQFYMQEIDRREAGRERQEDRRIATRDYRMELGVMALIGLELIAAIWSIVIAVREGKEQAEILTRLNQSSAATASMLKALQPTMEAMNTAIQAEQKENTQPAANAILQGGNLTIANAGRPTLIIHGGNFGGKIIKEPSPIAISQGQMTYLSIPTLYQDMENGVKGKRRYSVTLDLYVETTDGTRYAGKTRVTAIKESEQAASIVNIERITMVRENWK